MRLSTGSVAGAAGIVAAGFIGSRLLGLVRSVVIADAFGTEPELSAYFVAFRVPDLIFQVLAGATLSAAFIPTFSRTVLEGGERAGWRLASSVLNLVSIATLVAAVLAFAARAADRAAARAGPGRGDGPRGRAARARRRAHAADAALADRVRGLGDALGHPQCASALRGAGAGAADLQPRDHLRCRGAGRALGRARARVGRGDRERGPPAGAGPGAALGRDALAAEPRLSLPRECARCCG